MKIHTFPQRSDEWYAHREACLATASDFGPWLVKNDATSQKARRKRICDMIQRKAEKDEWQRKADEDEKRKMSFNIPVQRGTALEDEARSWLEDRLLVSIGQVGLITTDDGLFGCSPDGMDLLDDLSSADAPQLGDGSEIKCPWPDTHVGYVLAGVLPDEYRYQVHGSMVIAERRRWRFLSYCPGHPQLRLDVHWDQTTDELKLGMERFAAEYRELEALYTAKADEFQREMEEQAA